MNSVNIASLPSQHLKLMTSHCCSYPEATATLNLPNLLSAQGKINVEKEATAASRLWRVKVMPDTSQLPAEDPPNFKHYECLPNSDTLCLKKTIISASVACCDNDDVAAHAGTKLIKGDPSFTHDYASFALVYRFLQAALHLQEQSGLHLCIHVCCGQTQQLILLLTI